MSSQEKKNFLMRYRDCEREIVRLEEEIARWQSRAERITAGYSPAPGAHGETRDRIQEAVCEMAELRGALYDRLLDAAAVRREIERAIASLGEERLRLLLEYRYIDGLTLEAAAEPGCTTVGGRLRICTGKRCRNLSLSHCRSGRPEWDDIESGRRPGQRNLLS